MRRALLAATTALILTSPRMALAQLLVDAPVLNAIQQTQLVTDIKNWASELQSWAKNFQQLQQQIQQLQSIYTTVSNVRNLGSAVAALNMLGIQNPLPVNAWALDSLIRGQNTSFSGITGALSGMVNQNFTASHVYSPTDGSFASKLMIDKGNGLAGIQGVSQQLYQSIAQRLPLMQQLADRIASSTDIKETADLQARLSAENAFVNSQMAQFQTVKAMADAQQAVWQQEREENRAKDIDDELAMAQAHGY